MRLASLFLLASLTSVFSFEELKQHGEDSERHDGVPKGKVEKQPAWESKIFPGTTRDWWIYVPAQYDPNTPANVMIFQDGGGPIGEKGDMRAPVVFDNLIHKKLMPVTIGIFINPGVLAPTEKSQLPRMNRSFEYDSVSDRYARFLLEEILPEVEKKYKLTHDPAGRALCGGSSGGSCAFTAAWFRPDAFGKVVSAIGSFTSLHGGNVYPDLIRKIEPKPLRIFMQDGDHDLDIYAGSWWHANMDVAAALRWSGYDYYFLQGHDGHSGKQLGVNFPEVMKWLWRNEPVAGKRPEKVDGRGVFEVLISGEGWKKVAGKIPSPLAATSDDAGNVYVASNAEGNISIKRIAPDGKVDDFARTSKRCLSLQFASNGDLYATTESDKYGIIAFDKSGKERSIMESSPAGRIAINAKGDIFFSGIGTVGVIDSKNEVKKALPRTATPLAVALTPDQGFLTITDPFSFSIQSFKIESNGELTNHQPFYTLQSLEGQDKSLAFCSAMDEKGRFYVTSINGIQIFDQAGRVIGILTAPERDAVVYGMCFGGANGDLLYIVGENGVYARKLNAKGVRSCKPPITPPKPQM